MPYKSTQFQYVSRKHLETAIRAFLLDLGWEEFDVFGAEKAQALLSVWSQPSDGQSVTIGSAVYTFKTALTPTDGQVLIGGSYAETLDNLKLAVNRTDPGTNDGVKYQIAAAHPDVVATDNADSTQYFEQTAYGEGTVAVSNTWGACSWSWQFVSYGMEYTRVFKSVGETGKEPPGYLWMQNNRPNNGFFFRAYQYWDAEAHTGTRRAYQYSSNENYSLVNSFSTSYICFLAGSLDNFSLTSNMMMTSGHSYGDCVSVGRLTTRWHAELTNTTDAIADGDNVSIPVVDSAGFKLGQEIQIVGVSEGCDKLVINGIPDSTHILVANVPRDYASGAWLGLPASTFGLFTPVAGNFYPCCYFTDAGLTVSTSGYGGAQTLFGNYTWATSQDKRYMASPAYFGINGLSNIGTLGEDILYCYLDTVSDVAIRNEDDSTPMTSTVTAGGNLTLTDDTKDWAANSLIGKYIVLTGNAGIGQVRKITGNSATELEIGLAWFTNPDNQTSYKICDQVYRGLQNMWGGSNMIAFRHTDDSVPQLPT